jgi:hypothetical protein
MLICYERKILLNGWLILADKFKRTGRHKKAKHMVLFVAIQNAQNMVIVLPKED